MRKKWVWGSLLFAAAGIVMFLSYLVFHLLSSPSPITGHDLAGREADQKKQGKHNVRITKIEENQKMFTEAEIIRYLHEMTHQKVRADVKWGAVPMTIQNIRKMIRIVQENKERLKHEDRYLKMLRMWKNENFSLADEQHS